MVTKKRLVVFIAVSAVTILSGCTQKKDHREDTKGDPGGPIIVIRPDPENNSSINLKCQTHPCWYEGYPPSDYGPHLPPLVKPQVHDKATEMPSQFTQNPVAWIKIVRKDMTSFNAKEVHLQVNSVWLDITIGRNGDIPTWTYGTKLKGRFRPRNHWPAVLLGQITDMKFVELNGNVIDPPVTIDTLKSIEMKYWQ